MKKSFLILLSLLLIIGVTFATGQSQTANMWLYYGITVIISLFFIALYYILSTVTQSAQVAARAKQELWSVISTIFLGIILYTAIFGTDITAKLVGGDTDATLWTVVHDEVGYQFESLQKAFREFHRGYYYLGKLVGYSYTSTKNVFKITNFEFAMPGIGLSPIYGQYGQIFSPLSQAMLFIIGELVIIKFAIFAVPLFIFPFGLLLRVLPPTKKWGSTVIALGIGMYFVLPFSAVFTSLIYRSLEGVAPIDDGVTAMQQNIIKDIGQPPFRTLICGESFPINIIRGTASLGSFGFRVVTGCPTCCFIISPPFVNPGAYIACIGKCITGPSLCSTISDYMYMGIVPTYQFALSGPIKNYVTVTNTDIEQITTTFAEDILPVVSYQWMLAVFLPVINFIITFGAIRALSTAIGGEVYLYGISKIM